MGLFFNHEIVLCVCVRVYVYCKIDSLLFSACDKCRYRKFTDYRLVQMLIAGLVLECMSAESFILKTGDGLQQVCLIWLCKINHSLFLSTCDKYGHTQLLHICLFYGWYFSAWVWNIYFEESAGIFFAYADDSEIYILKAFTVQVCSVISHLDILIILVAVLSIVST